MLLVMSQLSACMLIPAQTQVLGVYVAEREFEENVEAILTVRDYFAGLENNFLMYPSVGGGERMMLASSFGPRKYIPIEDENARLAMDSLIESGYVRVTKSNGLIYFMRWRDSGTMSGMVYSTDRHHPHSGIISFLTKVEPMSEEGWFYIETHQTEYRRHPAKGTDELRMDFDENREAILTVKDYFAGLEYNWLSFPIDSRVHVSGGRGAMLTGVAENVDLGIEEARESLRRSIESGRRIVYTDAFGNVVNEIGDIDDLEDKEVMEIILSRSASMIYTVIEIDNQEIEDALEFLLRQGYSRIEKNDGFIFFRRWGSERAGVGVVYSINGSRPTSRIIPYLTESIRFEGEDGWFYFGANYWYYRR